MKFSTVLAILLYLPSILQAELSFNKDIRPILSEKCFSCHGADEKHAKGKLQLHHFEAATKKLGKNKDRQAIKAGSPHESMLIERVFSDDPDEIMPPPKSHLSLSTKEKKLLKQWISEGAKYEKHWSFIPVAKQPLPQVKNTQWVTNAIDHFILAKLEEKHLLPAKKAEPGIMLRRLYLDLTGLPPNLETQIKFKEQASQASWEKAIDDCLESSDFAERMALEWLDAARYADTNGYSIDDHRDMWGWRDWVIKAFEENMPYNQFVLEQVAGDLLPNASMQQKIATGFLRNSMSTHEGGTIPEEYRVTYNIDKLDAVSTSIMGLTMKCAQCHNHKYDPISQKEFYQFYAYFNSSSESGYGGHGNARPMVFSTTAYCDENRIKSEMDWRIKTLEQRILESIPDHKNKYKAWKKKIISQANLAKKSPQIDKEAYQNLKWIWLHKKEMKEDVEFEKTIYFDQTIQSAQMHFTCDDQAEIFINQKRVRKLNDWSKPIKLNVKRFLKKGKNTITLKCRNNGGKGGALFFLKVKTKGGEKTILSDQTWKAKKKGEKKWNNAVELGDYGMSPWNNVFADQDKIQLHTLILKNPQELSSDDHSFLTQSFIKQTSKSVHVRTLQKEINTLKVIKDAGKVSTMIMDHGKRKTFILNRGQYDQPGEEVQTGVPSFLPPLEGDEKVANRLGLAKWLIRRDHPLTSRVIVNRVWQMIMGRGIVESSEDFGSQGSWPTHPKLLDWLAQDFMDHGWDLRHLVKTIVMSSTYQQSSMTNPIKQSIDPRNELHSRAPRFRLPAELIRDQALEISGLLNKKVGGPSVYPDQPDGLWKEISHYGYPSAFTAQIFLPGRGEKRYRKSMYTFWKRTSAPPSMTIFDAPTRETCSSRRMTTNTPLQALVLLNDPQFMKASQQLANKLIQWEDQKKDALSLAYQMVTGHAPSEKVKTMLQEMKSVYLRYYQNHPQEAKQLVSNSKIKQKSSRQAAWTMIASTLFNLDETITRQ